MGSWNSWSITKHSYTTKRRSLLLAYQDMCLALLELASQFDTSPPKWSELRQLVDKARSSLAPSLNDIPYRVYKNYPFVLKLLWKLISHLEGTRNSIRVWKGCDNLHPKRTRSLQHQPVQRTLFMVAKRVTNYLLENNYTDTSCQKESVLRFLGCVEHSAMIWEQI